MWHRHGAVTKFCDASSGSRTKHEKMSRASFIEDVPPSHARCRLNVFSTLPAVIGFLSPLRRTSFMTKNRIPHSRASALRVLPAVVVAALSCMGAVQAHAADAVVLYTPARPSNLYKA